MVAASGLSACDNPDLGKTFAEIKAIKVDDTGVPAAETSRKINKQDVDLVVRTAKSLTVGEGGLMDKSTQGRLQIAIVDPLQVSPQSEVPITVQEPVSPPVANAPDGAAAAPLAVPAPGRSIQVGSYGSLAAAKDAWRTLLAKYPGVDQYQPSFQPVTTVAGKALVRLKVGPVSAPGQAERLCTQLDIRDAWCSKAS